MNICVQKVAAALLLYPPLKKWAAARKVTPSTQEWMP